MEKHYPIVAALHIFHGSILLFVGMAGFLVIGAGGIASGSGRAILVTGTVALIALSMFLVFALPHIIGGIGLWKFRPWARTVLIVMSIFALPAFPTGTALGIYSLWVLFNTEGQALSATR